MSSPHPPDSAARDLGDYLREKIPLTRAMGMQVTETGARVVLEAPLEANINHLGTAFGGSLHALPTLASYAVLWTLLNEAGINCHVVIKHSSASYLQPVTGTIRAVCVRPSPEIAAGFIDDLRLKKKARLTLTAVVEGANAKPAVEFSGEFVAFH